MKILIVGYGGMGREVERAALLRGHTISGRVDAQDGVGDARNVSGALLSASDVAIEFSAAPAVVANAEIYAKAGIAAVVGTTGWESDRERVKRLVETGESAFLWGSNFSIGAHVFFALAEHAAEIVDSLPEYDLALSEMHHNRKRDAPSGTALTTASRILAVSTKKTKIVVDSLNRQISPEELHVTSTRIGATPGVHTLYLDSAADTIEIRHTARSRGGFAIGAVMAAEWLHGKKGFFAVEDFISELINDRSTK